MIKKNLFICILLLFILGKSYKTIAQDASFSQYYAAPLYLNPAMAGLEANITGSVNFRQQWKSIVIPYVTSQFSFIYPLYSEKATKEVHLGGVGVSLYNDRAGDGNFNTTGINVTGAYKLYLSKIHTVSLGIQAGMLQKKVNYGNLNWGQQYNPYIGSGFDKNINVTDDPNLGSRATYPDISSGAIYSFNAEHDSTISKVSAFMGIAAYHMNKPNESFYKTLASKLPILFKVHGGLDYQISRKISVSPNILFMIQNNVQLYNGGLYLNYSFSSQTKAVTPTDIIFGTWYRLKDSFILSTGLGNDNYTFGFSYDFNTSSLRYSTKGRGAFEVSLTVRRIKQTEIKRYHTPRI